jgi:hypothetical protein
VHVLPPKAADDEELRGANERSREVPIAVVKQRVSNLAHGSLCLVLLTRAFSNLLNLVPQGEYTVSSLLLLCLTRYTPLGVIMGLLCVALPIIRRADR